MRTRSRLLLAGLAAALLLATAVASSSAGRLSISNQRFRITWAAIEFHDSGGSIRCPVSLEGSFHSASVQKILNALVGNITRGTALSGSCTGGRVTINQEALPWHVRYRGFRGVLPTIEGLDVSVLGAKFTTFGGETMCTTQTTAASPALGIARLTEIGRISSFIADERAEIPLRGQFLCNLVGNGAFAGAGSVSVLGTTTSITVTLI